MHQNIHEIWLHFLSTYRGCWALLDLFSFRNQLMWIEHRFWWECVGIEAYLRKGLHFREFHFPSDLYFYHATTLTFFWRIINTGFIEPCSLLNRWISLHTKNILKLKLPNCFIPNIFNYIHRTLQPKHKDPYENPTHSLSV